MADVLVTGGSVADGKVTQLKVEMHGLPDRTLDRDQAIALMKDGHSFVPRIGGRRGPALLLLEVGEEHYIRAVGTPEPADVLPDALG